MCQIAAHTLGSSGYSMERKVILSEIFFLVLKKFIMNFMKNLYGKYNLFKLLKKEERKENELKELPVVKMRNRSIRHGEVCFIFGF